MKRLSSSSNAVKPRALARGIGEDLHEVVAIEPGFGEPRRAGGAPRDARSWSFSSSSSVWFWM